MDQDQSPESQAALACLMPPETSSSVDPGPMCVAGPGDGGSGNPVLASVPPASVGSVINSGIGGAGTGAGILATNSTNSNGMNNGAGIVGGLSGMYGGGVDINTGLDQLQKGNTATGVYDLAKGGLEEGVGAATLVTSPAVAALASDGAAMAPALSNYAGAGGGALAILGGGEDINQGYNDLNSHDNTTQTTGALEIGKGGLEVGGGVMTTLGALGGASTVALGADVATLTGAAAATSAGLVAAAGAAGIGAGMGMEAATKGSGLFHQDGVVGPDGKPINESGAEKTADWGQDVANWIDPSSTDPNTGAFHAGGGTGEGIFDGNFSMAGLKSSAATAAGIGTTILGSTTAGLAMDVAGTAVSGYNWLTSVL